MSFIEAVASFDKVDLSQCKLPMFVVYEKPTDYPKEFVVRLFDCNQPTQYFILKTTLKEARKVIPRNLVHFPRSVTDQKQIVETWF
jgi:hypothetical protein